MLSLGCVMPGDEFQAKVQGLPDLRAALLGIAPKLRKRALRNALAAGARAVRDAAQAATPVLSAPVRHRKPGTVRQAITVRTSKQARRAGDVGVFVNVRPAKGTAKGAKSERDPYYWRWLNFGWTPASTANGGPGKVGKAHRRKLNKAGGARAIAGRHFLEAGGRALAQALEIFKAKIGPQLQRLNGGKGVEL